MDVGDTLYDVGGDESRRAGVCAFGLGSIGESGRRFFSGRRVPITHYHQLQREHCGDRFCVREEGWPSGQRQQTVNLPTYVYVGSNPTPSTTRRGGNGVERIGGRAHGRDGFARV